MAVRGDDGADPLDWEGQGREAVGPLAWTASAANPVTARPTYMYSYIYIYIYIYT